MEQDNKDQSLRDAVRDAMQDAMRDQNQIMQQMLQTMQAMMARMEVQNRGQPMRAEEREGIDGGREMGFENLEAPPIRREQQRHAVGLPRAMAENGDFSFAKDGNAVPRSGLRRIQTHGSGKKPHNGICHDDSAAPVKAQTIDELHSLQKKRSAPTTPIKEKDGQGGAAFASLSEEERQKIQLQSISASLASLTRETGPKVVKGDPARKAETPKVGAEHHHFFTPAISVSDSALKFTHVLYNLSPAELYEQAIKYEKGSFITSTGALATLSGAKTGRSPRDKRVVKDETTAEDLWWGKGSPNIEMDEHTFLVNRERAVDYLNSLEKVFVNDQFLNWDPENRIKVRIVSARAYHSLFMHNMCIRPTPEELENFGTPDFTIYNAGQFPCNRYTHYMTTSTSIDLNLARREMVILGTQYAGEMKKGLFSVRHYLMPKRQILSLHSGCNMGKDGDVALFFGLSGTGKTTLSTYHNRLLIGDDEHCWGDNGVSNIEGGCYAKCIDLSKEKEPDIWNAIKFGTVLENVVFDEHKRNEKLHAVKEYCEWDENAKKCGAGNMASREEVVKEILNAIPEVSVQEQNNNELGLPLEVDVPQEHENSLKEVLNFNQQGESEKKLEEEEELHVCAENKSNDAQEAFACKVKDGQSKAFEFEEACGTYGVYQCEGEDKKPLADRCIDRGKEMNAKFATLETDEYDKMKLGNKSGRQDEKKGENSSLRSSFSEEGVSDEDINSDQSSGQVNQSSDVPVPAIQSQQATSGKPTPGSPRRSKRLQNKRA